MLPEQVKGQHDLLGVILLELAVKMECQSLMKKVRGFISIENKTKS